MEEDSHQEDVGLVIIFIIGPPGTGKSTMCKLAISELGKLNTISCHHLSVGDYLREICKKKPSCDEEAVDIKFIERHLNTNQVLPPDILIPLLVEKLESDNEQSKLKNVWLIDGFPRSMETALAFEEKIGDPHGVIEVQCSAEMAKERFVKRGREISDDEGRWKTRAQEHLKAIKQIRDHYDSRMEYIDANGPEEEILEPFMKALRKMILKTIPKEI
ncbi:P-loop containing nucleoside triphosphate hydrolase protein [Xylariaceae sp. FL0255]|nr:P-loop containing nucleoside triphosphate hydrolase protein [Xylariaceae sp. FL0255]